jgi:hypothetical protein
MTSSAALPKPGCLRHAFQSPTRFMRLLALSEEGSTALIAWGYFEHKYFLVF